MRHALAPGTGDPPEFRLDDCTTRRNLSDTGRAQARATGEAIRAAVSPPPDAVLTSRWCRCRETAELLGLGAPEPTPPLDSFLGRRHLRDDQTEALRALLAERLSRGERLVLVTHQVNVTALTGIVPRSGEAVAVRLAADGSLAVLGTVPPAAP